MGRAQAGERERVPERAQLSVIRLASRFQSLSLLQPAAAHDFKGSLNTLSLNVQLLEHTLSSGANGLDAEVQRRCVKSLRKELATLERLTGAMLEEGRADDSECRTFNLSTVLEDAALLLQPTAGRRQVRITLERPSEDISVMGRAPWIRHAVLNLAGNALQAMAGGGALHLALRRDDACAVISVADTGPGIPADVRERMWDLNYSTCQRLGIGLPVVAHIVEVHGGTVGLEPSEVGARFVMRLPLAG